MIKMAYDGMKLENLIDPQVLAEFLNIKLIDAIKFAPLCGVNRDLEGRPGSTLTIPVYDYIGTAEEVPEGDDVKFGQFGKNTIDVKVKKAGRGVRITDEAILSGYGDPVNEIAKQLLVSIAERVDQDCIAVFRREQEERAAEMELEGKPVPEYLKRKVVDCENAEFNKNMIVDMIAEFGEDIEGEMTLIVNPKHLAKLRKDADFVHVANGQAIMSGEIGQIFGARVVVSNNVEANEMFLVKNGAVNILMKRDVMVETDRDIVNKTNIFVVDEHYAVYLADATKVVKAKNIQA
jgi:N4-gp56 family major capsid protein